MENFKLIQELLVPLVVDADGIICIYDPTFRELLVGIEETCLQAQKKAQQDINDCGFQITETNLIEREKVEFVFESIQKDGNGVSQEFTAVVDAEEGDTLFDLLQKVDTSVFDKARLELEREVQAQKEEDDSYYDMIVNESHAW